VAELPRNSTGKVVKSELIGRLGPSLEGSGGGPTAFPGSMPSTT
jgi:hypothetical protein